MRFRFQTAITAAISTTFRLCSTVAVAELVYLMAAKKLYWHSKSPVSAKASSHSTSRRTFQILKTRVCSLGSAVARSTIPESSIRTAVSQSAARL